jgi:hypothetical protein
MESFVTIKGKNPNDKNSAFLQQSKNRKRLNSKNCYFFRSAPTAPAQPNQDQNGDEEKGDENLVIFSDLNHLPFPRFIDRI